MYEPSIAHFAELAGEKIEGARRSPIGFFIGAMLAGAYISIAMILALNVATGIPAGVRPLVMGSVFGIGLILTVFAGAELFTGYVMYLGFGLARGRISAPDIVWVLILVWFGNLCGALIVTALFVAGGAATVFTDGGELIHGYAAHKVDADAIALVARAILCNWLVCLAIWTSSRVQGDAAKCIVLAWVLLAFVGTGFEHSVANMTALSLGLLVPDPSISVSGAARNLLLVTAGNVVGGLLPVVSAYLIAGRTDMPIGPAMHDAGPLPTTLRSARPIAAD
jgi:nitrite transporter NirC